MEKTTEKKALGYRLRVGCPFCKKFLWMTAESYTDVTCPGCQKQVAGYVRKILALKPEHDGPKCGGACQVSKSGDCECSCGGKNHGIRA